MRENSENTSPAKPSLDIFDVIAEAWRLTKGAKWALNAPQLVIILVCGIGITFIGLLDLLIATFHPQSNPGLRGELFTQNFAYTVFSYLLFLILVAFIVMLIADGIFGGMIKTAIERARGHAISAKMGFKSFSRLGTLFSTQLIILIFFIIPAGILSYFIPHSATILGILIGTFFYLSPALAVDHTRSPFSALWLSFKAIRPHWLKILGLYVITYMISFNLTIPFNFGLEHHNNYIVAASIIFLLIALVWVGPFLFLLQGVVYRRLIDPTETEADRMHRELQEELERENIRALMKPRHIQVSDVIGATWLTLSQTKLSIAIAMLFNLVIAFFGFYLMPNTFFADTPINTYGGLLNVIGSFFVALPVCILLFYCMVFIYGGMMATEIGFLRGYTATVKPPFFKFPRAFSIFFIALIFVIMVSLQSLLPYLMGTTYGSYQDQIFTLASRMLYIAAVIPFFILSIPLILDKPYSIATTLFLSIRIGLRYWIEFGLVLLYLSILFVVARILIPMFMVGLVEFASSFQAINILFSYLAIFNPFWNFISDDRSVAMIIVMLPLFCGTQAVVYHGLIDERNESNERSPE